MDPMNTEKLGVIAKRLVAEPKGILAADASAGTMNKRLDSIDVDENEENRRRYRQLLFTTTGIEDYISGVILYDGTIHQATDGGEAFVELLKKRDIIPGIKVDLGTEEFPESPNERITKGIDTLASRLPEYVGLGCEFAKWRSVITIGDNIPTDALIERNTKDLAQYAKICQKAGLVPIVEPEVLMKGNHGIETCKDVTRRALTTLFHELSELGVYLPGVILKSNMVLAGSESSEAPSPKEDVAAATLEVFNETVPHDLGGIVFLSGGQEPVQAAENLNEMAKVAKPWPLTFSYSRALQEPVLDAWQGSDANVDEAQKIFAKRCALASKARMGEYSSELE